MDGELVSDKGPVESHVLSYFDSLFLAPQVPRDYSVVKEVIPPLVSAGDNMLLFRMPTGVEIKKVVFSMDPHFAPGPDGFSGLFL